MTFDEVTKLFINSRLALGCSENTTTWYKSMLRKLGQWMDKNNKTYDAVNLLNLQEFLAYLRPKYSPNTVRQAATAVITFYKWMKQVKLAESNLAEGLVRPRSPDTLPPVASRSHTQQLMQSIECNVWMDYRDRVVVRVLFSTGIRLSECADLDLSDVDLDKKRLRIRHGKGDKFRFAFLPGELVTELAAWINHQRPKTTLSNLFLSSSAGGRVRGGMHSDTIYYMLRRRSEEAGIEFVSPHGFRHGHAHDLLNNGASTRLIQSTLGHSNIQTTERYLRVTNEEAQKLFDKTWQELGQTPVETKATEPPKAAPPKPEAGSTTTTATFWVSGTD